MRKPTPLAAGAVVLAAASLGSALVVISARPAASASGDRVISFYYHELQQTLVDEEPKGDTAGDRYLFSGDLLTRPGGRTIGRAGGFCDTVGSATSHHDWFCVFNFFLADGQVAVQSLNDIGALYSNRPVLMPIVGGTGAYRAARGQLLDRTPPNQPDSYFTLRLQ